ncbi:hypothetical protein LCGC14_0635090 [marine sediment metagenome]|uniref:Uncharacterized protein n=1 Tax=marine sediment metagenome TaxID=412755 RepID=A0A0F9U978_9ZZZZ
MYVIFIIYFIAFLFSWISKVFVVFQINVTQDGSIIAWFYNIILDFRLSELFVTIAIFLSYILKLFVFEKDVENDDDTIQIFNNLWDNIVIIYVGFSCVFVLFIYENGNTFLNVIAFLIVFIYIVMVYAPFLRRALQYRAIQDYKQAILSLKIMLISFMLIFLIFFIDRLLIFLGFTIFYFLGSPDFTVFYFLPWIFAIVGIYGAYYGLKSPKSNEE